jgi:outer membrane receptor protein involved in Fe transport
VRGWRQFILADAYVSPGRITTELLARSGFANTQTVPAYTQVNLGVSHEFTFTNAKPLTLRFDVVNVFDTIYEIGDGSGIGVFAPQFGPRRGFFVKLSRKF